MSLSKSAIEISKDGWTALFTREKALEFIKRKGLEKVELGSFNSSGILYFTLGHLHAWAWNTDLIRRELSKFNIPLKRDHLEFYTATVDEYPLFILKDGFDKAICVAPTEFEMEEI